MQNNPQSTEWWEDEKYTLRGIRDEADGDTYRLYDVPAIISRAKEMERDRVLAKAMEIVEEEINTWKEPEWSFERHDALVDYMTRILNRMKYRLSHLQQLTKEE